MHKIIFQTLCGVLTEFDTLNFNQLSKSMIYMKKIKTIQKIRLIYFTKGFASSEYKWFYSLKQIYIKEGETFIPIVLMLNF